MSRRVTPLLLSACLVLCAVGCDTVIRVAGLRVLAPSPDPGQRELASRQRALDVLVERMAEPDLVPSGEVILKLSLTGGWGLPGRHDLHLTIEDDGRVVRVTDTSVHSSRDDYSSLRVSRAGIIRVLESIRPLLPTRREDLDAGSGVSPTDRSAWLEVGDAFALSTDRIGQTEGYTAEQQAERERFGQLLKRIEDLTWLGEDIVEAESPWIPASMTVLAGAVTRSGLGPETPFAPWPLGRSIEELAVGTAPDAYGEEQLVLCLSDDQVAPVFALLTGVNHAHLRVDDGKAWELDVRPHIPGYRLYEDRCP